MKKTILGLLMALVSATSFADYIVSGPQGTILARTNQACPASVLQHVVPEHQNKFRKADALIEGQKYVACWTEIDGMVFIVYEDGDHGMIPAEAFRALKDV
jgi:hypothetical protein